MWQMPLVHLLGFIVRESYLLAYGKSIELYPALTTARPRLTLLSQKIPRCKPRLMPEHRFCVFGVLAGHRWDPFLFCTLYSQIYGVQ